jgi:predicted O-methyltransferase YrrM
MDTSRIVSAWRGLEPFAHWLVQTVDPKLTVELGVDYGFSLIELARHSKGDTVGVDHFGGDAQAGYRDIRDEAKSHVLESGFGISLMVMPFAEALHIFDAGTIDILHIDGAHEYDSVKHDFDTWLPKVRLGGVILLHDTRSFPNDVGRFFQSITFPKFEIEHSHGLGVVTKA